MAMKCRDIRRSFPKSTGNLWIPRICLTYCQQLDLDPNQVYIIRKEKPIFQFTLAHFSYFMAELQKNKTVDQDQETPQKDNDRLSPAHPPTSERGLTGQEPGKMTDNLELSADHNDQMDNAPLIEHLGRWNRLSCLLLWLALTFLLSGIVLLLVFLIGGCNEVTGVRLEDSLGFSCCRWQETKGVDPVSICRNKFQESKALGILGGGIGSVALSFVLLVYSRKHYYSLNYAFFDWK